MNKAFRHFWPNFWHIWWFFKMEHAESNTYAKKLKKIWRIAFLSLNLTDYLAHSGKPKIRFRFSGTQQSYPSPFSSKAIFGWMFTISKLIIGLSTNSQDLLIFPRQFSIIKMPSNQANPSWSGSFDHFRTWLILYLGIGIYILGSSFCVQILQINVAQTYFAMSKTSTKTTYVKTLNSANQKLDYCHPNLPGWINSAITMKSTFLKKVHKCHVCNAWLANLRFIGSQYSIPQTTFMKVAS